MVTKPPRHCEVHAERSEDLCVEQSAIHGNTGWERSPSRKRALTHRGRRYSAPHQDLSDEAMAMVVKPATERSQFHDVVDGQLVEDHGANAVSSFVRKRNSLPFLSMKGSVTTSLDALNAEMLAGLNADDFATRRRKLAVRGRSLSKLSSTTLPPLDDGEGCKVSIAESDDEDLSTTMDSSRASSVCTRASSRCTSRSRSTAASKGTSTSTASSRNTSQTRASSVHRRGSWISDVPSDELVKAKGKWFPLRKTCTLPELVGIRPSK